VTPLLSCRGLDVSYGHVQVLFGVDFEVSEGELVALLGTNGAGKSTLLKAVAGLVAPGAGTVTLDGRDVTGASTEARARAGVALMPGGKGVFPGLTVEEHLRLAGWLFRGDRRRWAEARDEALALFPHLAERLDQPAANLSGGEQQMLALARALIQDPQVVLADELSVGLAPVVVDEILEAVSVLRAEGRSLLIVEQYVERAVELADYVYILHKGRIVFVGEPAQCASGVVFERYLGGAA
jgi:ABC-type branched-subunit amino acid transport system ATPase component